MIQHTKQNPPSFDAQSLGTFRNNSSLPCKPAVRSCASCKSANKFETHVDFIHIHEWKNKGERFPRCIHATFLQEYQGVTGLHTHNARMLWLTFDFTHTRLWKLALIQSDQDNTQPVCFVTCAFFFTTRLFKCASNAYRLTGGPLKSRHKLVWPQLPEVNHKHSNYLINRSPSLNQHGAPSLPWQCLVTH